MMTNYKYQERILDAWSRAKNATHPKNITHSNEAVSSVCGDSVYFEATIVDSRIIELAVFPRGCCVSEGCAQLLSEWAVGKTVEAVQAITNEEFLRFLDVELPKSRLSCVRVSLKALKGLDTHVPRRPL